MQLDGSNDTTEYRAWEHRLTANADRRLVGT
jgi:hypothetical protein